MNQSILAQQQARHSLRDTSREPRSMLLKREGDGKPILKKSTKTSPQVSGTLRGVRPIKDVTQMELSGIEIERAFITMKSLRRCK